jgi:hypothetical protein
MIWTAISFNWSAGQTAFYVFSGSHSHAEASEEFLSKFPGENLLALVAGDHTNRTATYPLLVPNSRKLKQEEKNDSIA